MYYNNDAQGLPPWKTGTGTLSRRVGLETQCTPSMGFWFLVSGPLEILVLSFWVGRGSGFRFPAFHYGFWFWGERVLLRAVMPVTR